VKKLSTLLILYFAQGLPFGFQATALPVLLRARGVSLQAIGFASLLAAPWLTKALWAPWVDRYGSARWGRRKSWIVPMQAALCVSACIAAHVERPKWLAFMVLVMNLFAATQDIAVDGLAVSWLEPHEIGMGNAAQVVGYKLGMLTGGGLLVWASDRIGMHGLFYVMAAAMFMVMLTALGIREPQHANLANHAQAAAPHPGPQLRLIDVWHTLGAAFREPAALPLLCVVCTYKMGETLADGMWKPMLFDRGFTASQIGLWMGTYGTLASLLGSAAAGVWVRNMALPQALVLSAALRALGVGAEWWLSTLSSVTSVHVILVTCAEHFVGGSITTVVFALMMRNTRREIGGTHYTLLASLEVWGKMPFALLSGVIAQRIGYVSLFALGTGVCVAFAGLTLGLRPRLDTETQPDLAKAL